MFLLVYFSPTSALADDARAFLLRHHKPIQLLLPPWLCRLVWPILTRDHSCCWEPEPPPEPGSPNIDMPETVDTSEAVLFLKLLALLLPKAGDPGSEASIRGLGGGTGLPKSRPGVRDLEGESCGVC